MVATTLPQETSQTPQKAPMSGFKRWLLDGYVKDKIEGPHEQEHDHRSHSWYQVMCLTGVDYFSTLGYQPGIAILAAGALSPVATMILVLLTLLGALPIYRRVAQESPHGEGSISMLAHLLPQWAGKLFILVLLGFVATDFIITITLSAADATAHIVENPLVHNALENFDITTVNIVITLGLITLLAGVFLKGFKEAIGIAVVLVIAYILLNLVVIAAGVYEIVEHPDRVGNWTNALFTAPAGGTRSVFAIIGIALLVFPKLALGLSGFETGVAVMGLVKGDAGDTAEKPAGRIRNTQKLLLGAALIMSVLLIASSLVTTILIPTEAFRPTTEMPPGEESANGRALAYLAHELLGNGFGTVYDVSTILILWFAGASAMAGLLNIVPRYLPRYGMAPEWTIAMRPLVLIFTAIAFAVTIIFRADVNAQGGAYATGVLVLMTSAAIAVTISAYRNAEGIWSFLFGLIALVFAYTTAVNVYERPDGIRIAAFFIGLIIVVSFVSRLYRTTELRVANVELDEEAERFIAEACARGGKLRILPNRREEGDETEYRREIAEKYDAHQIPETDPALFLEVDVGDASEFAGTMKIKGYDIGGYKVLRAESTTIPNAIAAFLLYLRDRSGKIPHAYFNWGQKNPVTYLMSYVAFGTGDTAPVTNEVLRQAEPDSSKRPVIHVGGF